MSTMKMHVFDLGRMHMDKSLLIANWQLANVQDPNPRREFCEFPISAYFIEHPAGNILFDAGCHPDSMGPNGRWPAEMQNKFPWSADGACYLPNRLRQLGKGPEDVKYVVLSHMHNDHCGCIEYFGKSAIFVHRDEFNAALTAYALHDNDGPYVWKDTATWTAQKLDWRLLDAEDGDLDLADGVRILNLGSGHSYGMLGLMVSLPKYGKVILASDAIYCGANARPVISQQGVAVDTAGWRNSVRKLLRLAAETGAEIWFGHDAEQFKTLRHSPDDYYE